MNLHQAREHWGQSPSQFLNQLVTLACLGSESPRLGLFMGIQIDEHGDVYAAVSDPHEPCLLQLVHPSRVKPGKLPLVEALEAMASRYERGEGSEGTGIAKEIRDILSQHDETP